MEVLNTKSTLKINKGAKSLLFALGIFTLSITLSSLVSGQVIQENCRLNCIKTEINGNKLTTRVYNNAGKVTKVINTRLPKYTDSKTTLTSDVTLTSDLMSTDDGGKVVVDVLQHYSTATEIVIVRIYVYYDAEGNIKDVKVVTTRFSKNIEK